MIPVKFTDNNPNRLDSTLTYLSGPMDRVDEWSDAVRWRDELKPFLFPMGVGILDPCDKACAFVEDEQTRDRIVDLKEEGDYEELQRIMKPICKIDLRMVDIAHFLILYVDLDVHSCGSYHEAFEACSQKKPVLTVCKQGKENIPNWMFGVIPHEMMFSNFDQLKQYLLHVNSSHKVDHMNRWRFLDMDYVYGRKDSVDCR